MTRYIIRRSIQSFILMLVSSLIAFTVYQAAPGGPIQFLDDDPKATAADANRLNRSTAGSAYPGAICGLADRRGLAAQNPPGRAAAAEHARQMHPGHHSSGFWPLGFRIRGGLLWM